ncbi:hypothetical protein Nepgr_032161 [Nepenthes gracilis]|uniref:DUF7032 domain-containing protein n=1 Tax=Nepenthes gracilis TaxID=150966 RepID=A0AAD3TI45_NEPGR|nr:hypothetical protein Nepgr_032161 [Nepenthes gracilis]
MGEEESAPEKGATEAVQNCLEASTAALAGEAKIRRAIQVMTSLISDSDTIKVFPAKWQMIRGKLQELNSGLSAAEHCHSTENQALSDLVTAIMESVRECQGLVHRCINLSYSGKLQMKSDLNLICVKFDAHIRNLSGIYSAGILSNGFEIVVSRPSFGASREDMRFYVKDLLTRLKIGSFQMKKQALVSLNEIIVVEGEKIVRIAVEMNEMVLLLADFLDSSESEVQEESAKSVLAIAGFDSLKKLLVRVGIIAPLIRVLDCGSAKGKEYAIKSLQKLTENADNAWSLSAHGGVTALLSICSNEESMGDLISPACVVLRNLTGVEEIKRFMIEEGAITTFVNLIRSRDELTQINAIEFLQTMAFGDESTRQMIIRGGGIRALLRALDPKSHLPSYKLRETAFKAVEILCFNSNDSLNLLVDCGFMDQLLYFLRKGEASIQELALKSAFRLSGTSEAAKKIMGDLGFMLEFLKFLEAKSREVREMAAEALFNVVMVPKNRKKFVQEDRNVGVILQLIDPEEGNSVKLKFLLSTLLSLSSSTSARRRICNSGYMKNLEKLAEIGVSDAKKITRKLSENRFQAMLSGILHS